MNIQLTLEEFNHLIDSKGKCNCELCKKFKNKLEGYLKSIGMENDKNIYSTKL